MKHWGEEYSRSVEQRAVDGFIVKHIIKDDENILDYWFAYQAPGQDEWVAFDVRTLTTLPSSWLKQPQDARLLMAAHLIQMTLKPREDQKIRVKPGQLTIAFIENQIKESPESMAIVLTYLLMPTEEALKTLAENALSAIYEGHEEAASALGDIHRMIRNSDPENLEMIRNWCRLKVKQATGRRLT